MLGQTKQIVARGTQGDRKLTLFVLYLLIVLSLLFNAHDALLLHYLQYYSSLQIGD